jgi:hypothetical protein
MSIHPKLWGLEGQIELGPVAKAEYQVPGMGSCMAVRLLTAKERKENPFTLPDCSAPTNEGNVEI